jgi:hypothetical protein
LAPTVTGGAQGAPAALLASASPMKAIDARAHVLGAHRLKARLIASRNLIVRLRLMASPAFEGCRS